MYLAFPEFYIIIARPQASDFLLRNSSSSIDNLAMVSHCIMHICFNPNSFRVAATMGNVLFKSQKSSLMTESVSSYTSSRWPLSLDCTLKTPMIARFSLKVRYRYIGLYKCMEVTAHFESMQKGAGPKLLVVGVSTTGIAVATR